MGRFGLALSGGGYRATIYHLGVLRFLRDANLLSKVSHITSVSGGSIVGAHLVMHWDRYAGSEQSFDEAAHELLDFTRRDVRNRIVRRFPLAFLMNATKWAMQLGWSRRLTRPGLLEAHYEKFLFGDKCLYELPVYPQLHMLATNINEGCLCSFTRSGMLVERRTPTGGTDFDSTNSTLATIPMGVAASSAFPGFFPPMPLVASDVGADEGRFPAHVLTDGGVYDNLGVRMFRHIKESWIGHDTPLIPEDFVDNSETLRIFNGFLEKPQPDSRLSSLAQLVRSRSQSSKARSGQLAEADVPTGLWNVIANEKLYLDPTWQSLELEDQQASEVLQLARRRDLQRGDQLWLNRCLVNAAAIQETNHRILRSNKTEFDTVIVSDAGKEFGIMRKKTGGGLIGTAVRASDILMDRVWKLEVDQFGDDPSFAFVPISGIVDPSEDPTALHPNLQRQVACIRTDLDRFSDLEISGLTRHGYGLMRKVCRSRPDIFGENLPIDAPWDPTGIGNQSDPPNATGANVITRQARQLQSSARRIIFGRLLSFRDWPTYVYLPLIILLFVVVPYLMYRSYRVAHRSEQIVDAITFSNPDFQTVLQLVRQNPIPGDWAPVAIDEVQSLEPVDNSGFVLVTDTRILDLRRWVAGSDLDEDRIVVYRRMRVRRKLDDSSTDTNNSSENQVFRFQQRTPDREISVSCDSKDLKPRFRMAPVGTASGEIGFVAEAEFDLSKVPADETADIGFEVLALGLQGKDKVLPVVNVPIVAETKVASLWVLLSEANPYEQFELLAYDAETGRLVKSIEPTYSFEMEDGTVFGWMLVDPSQKYAYECRWNYGAGLSD